MKSNARFVLHKQKVLEQYARVCSLGDSVSYSLKTNYSVGRVLEQSTSSFFSVHSVEGLSKVNDFSRVWFFAQGWAPEDLLELKGKGISRFVVDNAEDLNVLLNFVEKTGFKISLLLRMRLKENTIHTGKHFVFGFFSREINVLIPQLHKNNNVEKLGIHFHRKTQNVSEWNLKEELSDALEKQTLELVDIINIGGGIPAVYKNYRAGILDRIFSQIGEFVAWAHQYNIHVIVEPGRFLAAAPVTLETKVIAVYNNNIVVDASVYQSALDTFVCNIRLLVEGEQEQGIPFVIKGSTPCSTDIFRYRVFLKKVPAVGDTIRFLNAGAYNYSSDFCNLKPLETIVER